MSGEVAISRKTIGKAHSLQHFHTEGTFFSLLRWTEDQTQGCVCVWKRHRVSGGSGNAHLAEQKAERPADCLICQSKKRSAFGATSTLRRRQRERERKRKNCQWRKRKKKKRSELDLFSKCSHILGSTFACPCQKRVGRGGMREVERKSRLFFFFFSSSSAAQIKSLYVNIIDVL